MMQEEITRLKELYRKTGGGHIILSDTEFIEYATLRKKEYQDRKAKLEQEEAKNIRPVKDDAGDIIGFSWGSK